VVLRRILGPKREEVTGEWRKLHNEIKSRRMRWAGHVACMREERNVYKVLMESQKEREHLEDHGVDGRMRSEWILG
jgi:hypothetical protein